MEFDLRAAASRAMKENGFHAEFEPEVMAELATTREHVLHVPPGGEDLRGLLWSSIDNRESRDLDQIEVSERLPDGRTRLLVGIADVDAFVSKGSAIDRHAAWNTASVYTGVEIFPMLPEELSTGRTSLLADGERYAVVVEMTVAKDGSLSNERVFKALVVNRAKLTYDDVGDWLEGKGPLPEAARAIEGMEDQLRMQAEATTWLKRRRFEHGALEFETIEANPVAKDGRIVGLVVTKKSRARELIEDLMIAANGVTARFLEEHGSPSILRIVKTPKRWDRIVELARLAGTELPSEPSPVALSAFLSAQKAAHPAKFADLSLSVVKLLGPGEYVLSLPGAAHDGHFGLAVQDYNHSTAPNRRFADLVTQRLLKAAADKRPSPYSDQELADAATRCTQKENDARKVERVMRKVAAALFLSTRIGETFDAIVTGVTPSGTFVRLLDPPAEGRIVSGEKGLDVGDSARVKLTATAPEKGFIDFVVAAPQ